MSPYYHDADYQAGEALLWVGPPYLEELKQVLADRAEWRQFAKMHQAGFRELRLELESMAFPTKE